MAKGIPGKTIANSTQPLQDGPLVSSADVTATESRPSKRRKTGTASLADDSSAFEVVDLTEDAAPAKKVFKAPSKTARPSTSKSKTLSPTKSVQEKRLRRYRSHAPQSFEERLERVLTQRMFVIDREDSGSADCPEGVFEMAGTTGNVYTVKIGNLPSCTCPDNQKGNQCKHIVYVMVNVLKVSEPLQYQLAFLSSELREIFAKAPPPPKAAQTAEDQQGLRKPIEGDCPICVLEFEPDKEEIVWCKAGCGNNIHKQCFEQWAASKRGQRVLCVFCRSLWQGDEDSLRKIAKSGKVNEDGYVNVASELGLSGTRGE
ncbi:MAG: hypothetical protein M1833_005321 [Piccolia ochrophora]|nr:MAG: hypothetical protein M1833_005321 [Piccolia ochrophora]